MSFITLSKAWSGDARRDVKNDDEQPRGSLPYALEDTPRPCWNRRSQWNSRSTGADLKALIIVLETNEIDSPPPFSFLLDDKLWSSYKRHVHPQYTAGSSVLTCTYRHCYLGLFMHLRSTLMQTADRTRRRLCECIHELRRLQAQCQMLGVVRARSYPHCAVSRSKRGQCRDDVFLQTATHTANWPDSLWSLRREACAAEDHSVRCCCAALHRDTSLGLAVYGAPTPRLKHF